MFTRFISKVKHLLALLDCSTEICTQKSESALNKYNCLALNWEKKLKQKNKLEYKIKSTISTAYKTFMLNDNVAWKTLYSGNYLKQHLCTIQTQTVKHSSYLIPGKIHVNVIRNNFYVLNSIWQQTTTTILRATRVRQTPFIKHLHLSTHSYSS